MNIEMKKLTQIVLGGVLTCCVIAAILNSTPPVSQAQTANYCPQDETPTIGYGPNRLMPYGPRVGYCSICCDRPDGSAYWYRLPNWHSYCYPWTPRPTTTPTHTHTPTTTPTHTPTATPTPTPTPTPTTTPTHTVTHIQKLADTDAPVPTATRTSTPRPTTTPTHTPTWTLTPTHTVTHTPRQNSTVTKKPAPPSVLPTATSTRESLDAQGPVIAKTPSGANPSGSNQAGSEPKWRSDCIPLHAARPIALCETGSGSGWWLYWIGEDGLIESGPYLPNARTISEEGKAGERLTLVYTAHPLTSRQVLIEWLPQEQRIVVRTSYVNSKPYEFAITEDGDVQYMKW